MDKRAENVIGKGNRFSSTNQPANRGRKPRLYKTIVKSGYNIGRDEFIDVERMLIQETKEELDKIAKKDDTPIWVAIICRALIRSGAKGEVQVLNDISDRIFGKQKQEIEISGNQTGMSYEQFITKLKDEKI